MAPLAVAAAPAEGEDAVDELADFRFATVAQGGEVRDEAGIPEEHRHGEVGRDRENIPQERGAEVLPDRVGVWHRGQPPGHPHAADVERGVDAGANDREEGHRFGGAVDRGAPLLACEEKDRGNERARVADADPEHEVRDVPCPADGVVVSPNADAGGDEVAEERDAEDGERDGDAHRNPPPGRGFALDDRADVIADPAHRALVEHERLADEFFVVVRELLGMVGGGLGHFLKISGRPVWLGRRRAGVGRCGCRRGVRCRWPCRRVRRRAFSGWGCGCA